MSTTAKHNLHTVRKSRNVTVVLDGHGNEIDRAVGRSAVVAMKERHGLLPPDLPVDTSKDGCADLPTGFERQPAVFDMHSELDHLRCHVDALQALLAAPEPGLATWHAALNRHLRRLAGFGCPDELRAFASLEQAVRHLIQNKHTGDVPDNVLHLAAQARSALKTLNLEPLP